MTICGATEVERRLPLCGDHLVPDARYTSTHAVMIHADPEALWPWLVQMGCGRAGWYSYDRIDNGGKASAQTILPEFQHTRVGDILPARPGRSEGFEVLLLDAAHDLVLGSYVQLPHLRSLPWDAPLPDAFWRATWSFALRHQVGGTRLIVRVRGKWHPAWAGRLGNVLFGPAHALMQRRQLLNLKERAERLAVRPPATTVGTPTFELMHG